MELVSARAAQALESLCVEAALTEDPRPLRALVPQGEAEEQGAVDISESGWAPVIAELIAAQGGLWGLNAIADSRTGRGSR